MEKDKNSASLIDILKGLDQDKRIENSLSLKELDILGFELKGGIVRTFLQDPEAASRLEKGLNSIDLILENEPVSKEVVSLLQKLKSNVHTDYFQLQMALMGK